MGCHCRGTCEITISDAPRLKQQLESATGVPPIQQEHLGHRTRKDFLAGHKSNACQNSARASDLFQNPAIHEYDEPEKITTKN